MPEGALRGYPPGLRAESSPAIYAQRGPKGARVCASLGFAKELLAKPIDNTMCLPRRGTR